MALVGPMTSTINIAHRLRRLELRVQYFRDRLMLDKYKHAVQRLMNFEEKVRSRERPELKSRKARKVQRSGTSSDRVGADSHTIGEFTRRTRPLKFGVVRSGVHATSTPSSPSLPASCRENSHISIGSQSKSQLCDSSRRQKLEKNPFNTPLPPPSADEELFFLSDTNLDDLLQRLDAISESYRSDLSDQELERMAFEEFTSAQLASESPQGWTSAVNKMAAARELKERYLKQKPLPETQLDLLDLEESDACASLNGAFLFLMRIAPSPVNQPFNKSSFDKYMEEQFGSLNTPSQDLSKRKAREIFSQYLARKVWVPISWRKIENARDDFYSRVVDNPIKEPMNMKARNIAVRILNCLLDGADATPFLEREYVSESACIERGRKLGGKRFSQFIALDRANTRYVRACPIYTGGKIRVISIDSVENVQYTWINKFLGSRFRKLPCSVFGGDVAAWWERVGGLRHASEDAEFISGDLEAATDNFDGRITDSLIEEFCSKMHYPHSKRLKSFTTQAVFKEGKSFIKQTRGQLMGSVISFPFLCILSLTAYLFTKPDKWIEKFLHSEVKKSKVMLKRVRDVGVNGDDVAFSGNATKVQRWTEGVRAIGGVISRGKTLRNKDYFTINSELWCKDGKINCLRPSLLTALTGDNKYFISPQREWLEYQRCSLKPPEAEEIWQIRKKLKLSLPKAWGGLGLVHDFDSWECLRAFARSTAQRLSRGAIFGSERWLLEQEVDSYSERVWCFVPRHYAQAYSSRRSTRFANWRLSTEELAIAGEYLSGADQYRDQARILLPFVDSIKRVKPQYREAEILSSIGKSPKYDRTLAWLEDTYEVLMRHDVKWMRIPLELTGAYYATYSEAFKLSSDSWTFDFL